MRNLTPSPSSNGTKPKNTLAARSDVQGQNARRGRVGLGWGLVEWIILTSTLRTFMTTGKKVKRALEHKIPLTEDRLKTETLSVSSNEEGGEKTLEVDEFANKRRRIG